MKFFKFCEKLRHNFSDILHKVIVAYKPKIDLYGFFEKFFFEIFGPERARNGPKMRFFRYYQKSMLGAFLIFCMKLQ